MHSYVDRLDEDLVNLNRVCLCLCLALVRCVVVLLLPLLYEFYLSESIL